METILLVEEDPLEARTLISLLSDEYRVQLCPEPGRAPEAARHCSSTAIVLSLPPEPLRHEELVRKTVAEYCGGPVLVLANRADPAFVVACMRSGAFDFLAKPTDLGALRKSLAAAQGLARGREATAGIFIGRSAAIREIERLIRRFAESSFPVLILGESGTGKEVAARALREVSPTGTGPFVARNCAAIPENLAESELFGTERGAFTDAVARPGAFELAQGGLIFLDEIGEASLPVQAKLLRVLETGEFWRLGGKKSIAADFRFVSATGKDLPKAASQGSFRPDLLYRIDTLVVAMPPLRERREDIADLAAHFALLASRGRVGIGEQAIDKLSEYDWPGNIRQLRNVVHRGLVLAGRAEELLAEHIVF
jgi:two-component system response regulator AtoC